MESETNTQQFYSETLSPIKIDNDLELLAARVKDEPSLEILVDLARGGDLDPWDIDLDKVTSQYLKAISSNPRDGLREAGNAIFYASVLLRMKSDVLLAQSQSALNIGLHKELDYDSLLEAELADRPTTQITFDDLEAALRRRFLQKAKRFRKLTLADLIAGLQEAQKEEEHRAAKVEQRRLFDLYGYNIVAPDLSDDIADLTHAENLEECIKRLEMILPEHLFNGEGIEFKRIIEFTGSWSNAFLATIFLSHDHKVRLEQEHTYEELWIYEA